MILDPAFYAAALPATVLVGLSKGGFAGLSTLAQPLLAMVISPIQAAAIMLPVLIVQDIVSLYAYWRRWDARQLKLTLPGALLGIVLGYLMAANVSDATVQIGIGAIALGEATRRFLQRLKRTGAADAPAPGWRAGQFWGAVSGFTSMIANAGAPPFMIYLLRQKLGRDTFAATAVAFFSLVNWTKVPFFLALGQIRPENLATSAVLVPLAVVSTFAGVWLVKRVDPDRFFVIVYALLAMVGALLIYEGVAAL